MDYLETKKRILELKLAIVTIQIEKNEIIRLQQYEQACELRQKERELISALEEKKEEVLLQLKSFKTISSTMEETHLMLNLLLEFNQDEMNRTYSSIKLAFIDRMKSEYEELWNERRQHMREYRFREAYKIQDHILEIGRFLVENINSLYIEP